MEKPKLRPYQREDVIKLSKLRCTACLNEQRTGKTPTSLVTMKVQKHQKILIVCPGTASYDWKEKFELWLDRPCIVLDGTPKQREEKLKQWTDGLVITYDTLKIINHYDPADKDLPKKKRKVTHKTGELTHLLKHKIDAVIVDEFHRARNRKTLTAKSLYKLATIVPYRMALTGTPAYSENTDIWSMLHFLYPAKFDNYWKFVDEYFTITMKWTPNGMARNIGAMRPEKEKKLQAFLNQIATQRKQHDKDVMSWLPDSPEPKWIKLPATTQQQKHLDTLMEFYETDTVICKNTLDRLIRYRQICQDPRLLNLKGGSAKTNWLRQFYSDYPDAPTIVFSNFTSYLELLAAECPTTHALITGNITNQERKMIEQRFQNGEIQTLFINIKAGKETLTLDRAEHKIFLDVFTPIGDITQASSRFTPTCEERKSIPKTIWYLMLKDTFDEEIYYALETAKTTTDILNNFKIYLE
jgi:SNF2 family DNA or RNA helicase